jgi:hypothetical protein
MVSTTSSTAKEKFSLLSLVGADFKPDDYHNNFENKSVK